MGLLSGIDFGGLLQSGVDIAGNIFLAKEQRKAAEALAEAEVARSAAMGQAVQPPVVQTAQFQPGTLLPQVRQIPPGLGGQLVPTGLAGAAGQVLRQLPGLGAGLLADKAIEMVTGSGNGGGACPTLFTANRAATVRAAPLVMVRNPENGAPVFFRHAGRPILFSGDLAACGRVKSVEKRIARSARTRVRRGR